jgi:hypothetical protein
VKDERGMFTNASLQEAYNEMFSLGSLNVRDALNSSIKLEEMQIKALIMRQRPRIRRI